MNSTATHSILPTGVASHGFSGQQVTAVARRGGTLISPGGATAPWVVQEVVFQDGEIFLQGPFVAGRTLAVLLEQPTPGGALWLTQLVNAAVNALAVGGVALATTETTLMADDGKVLFLEEELARQVVRNLPADRRQRVLEPYADPRQSGNAQIVWFVLNAAYHQLTGSQPPQRLGSEPVDPIHLHNTAVRPVVAQCIESVLNRLQPATADVLVELQQALGDGGWTDRPSAEEAQQRLEEARRRHTSSTTSHRRLTFWRRNRTRMALVTIGAVLVLSVPLSILRNHLAPPATVGLEPMEVISAFYRGWSTLDHQLMEDALASGVAPGIIREVTNIFVIDRVRSAHEMTHFMVSPEAWYGMDPDQRSARIPYGPHNPELTVVDASDSRLEVIAEYWMYRPDGDDDQSAAVPWRTRMRDRLTVAPGRRSWEIVSLHSIEVEPPQRVSPPPD